jgi:hypothetical protein
MHVARTGAMSLDAVLGGGQVLAPEHARELAHVPSHTERVANVRDSGAQFGVADLYREHRVLEVGQRVVGGADLGDRAIDLRAGVPVTGGGLGERAGCHAGARGESLVGALRPAVGELDGPKWLFLEAVGHGLVERLATSDADGHDQQGADAARGLQASPLPAPAQ